MKNNMHLKLAVLAVLATALPACTPSSAEENSSAPSARSYQEGDQTSQDEASQDQGTTGGGTGGMNDGTGNGTGDGAGDGTGGGSDNGGAGGDVADPTDQAYSADFQPLNTVAGVSADGTATFTIANGQFSASVNATGLAPNVQALQHIHVLSRCPTAADDTNGDGYIDAVEEAAVSGAILVPLDSDLNQQMASTSPSPSPTPSPGATPAPGAAATYPTTDANGAYNYSQTAQLTRMLTDLRAPDSNPNDMVSKLDPSEPLALQNRVVIIHGVPATTVLPPTVQSIEGLPPQATLPVACGEIQLGGADTGPSPSPSPTPGASPAPSPSPSPTAAPAYYGF